MTVNCPVSCNFCHLRDPKVRCPRERLNTTHTLAYEPGQMNEMFSNLKANFGDRYGIEILSTSPWIVTFENFVSDEEIENILASVHGNWERSTDTGEANEFGEVGRVLSQGRTSSNAWCRHDCESNPHVQNVYKKISEVVGIDKTNFESFQILQYDIGQKYLTHHDAGVSQDGLACGPRILTFFLYLSDVEEGGETAFPTLGYTVKPKKGKALLWPSTHSHDPSSIDHRTMHEARPVIRGKKYAANAWIHLYDFEGESNSLFSFLFDSKVSVTVVANHWGCTGAFDAI